MLDMFFQEEIIDEFQARQSGNSYPTKELRVSSDQYLESSLIYGDFYYKQLSGVRLGRKKGGYMCWYIYIYTMSLPPKTHEK